MIVSRQEELKYANRVTYQLTMRGSDGVVMASDQCEHYTPQYGDGAMINRVVKITIDKKGKYAWAKGKYAWAYYGGTLGPFLAKHFRAALNTADEVVDEDIEKLIDESRTPAFAEWQAASTGASGESGLVCVSGVSGMILRCNAQMGVGFVDPIQGGIYISGNTNSRASLIPNRFYSQDLDVDTLAGLAAYAIYTAHVLDPEYVKGLDIAVFRNSIGRFEFADSDEYWRLAGQFDDRLLSCIKHHFFFPRP